MKRKDCIVKVSKPSSFVLDQMLSHKFTYIQEERRSFGEWVILGNKSVRTWNEGIAESLGEKASIDGLQFGFMPGGGLTDTIFIA